VTLDPKHHSYAAQQGWPTEPFTAVRAGRAPFVFWNTVRREDGTLLDLPPMYLLTATAEGDERPNWCFAQGKLVTSHVHYFNGDCVEATR
jgi:hypothetical protein